MRRASAIVVPHLPEGMTEDAREAALQRLLDAHLASIRGPLIAWYYTPMMLPFSRHLDADLHRLRRMDELSKFQFAPAHLLELEQELIDRADVVFTGGSSLYEAKKDRHDNVHCFPSSVDRAHFAKARVRQFEPADQEDLPRPRLGFYGVIDERFDIELLGQGRRNAPRLVVRHGRPGREDRRRRPAEAAQHPLSRAARPTTQLPAYLSGWDVALMPFAMNESTEFISPTKTPEYLAGGKPVVSTPIKDVVRHYGQLEGVQIAVDAGRVRRRLREGAGAVAQAGKRLARRGRPAAVGDELGHHPGAHGRPDRTTCSERAPARRTGPAGSGGMSAPLRAPSTAPLRLSDRRRRLCRLGPRRAAGEPARRARAADRPARRMSAAMPMTSRTRPGSCTTSTGRTSSTPTASRSSTTCRSSPSGGRTSIACCAVVRDQLVPIPINRTTLNELFDLDLKTDEEAADYLASRAEPVDEIQTSEDVVINAVGRELYELFFQGYTRKQWGLDPSELDKSVTARIPTRTNTDDRYFTDTFQAMPRDGYTAMFERMLDHPLIEVRTGVDFRDVQGRGRDADHIIYTGPIDEYFDLPLRQAALPQPEVRSPDAGAGAVPAGRDGQLSRAEDVPYTRISEYKHLTGQELRVTTITYEYPSAEGDPYYPIPRPENQELFKRYEALADATEGVTFVGGWRPIATTTWTRSSGRRWRPSGAWTRKEPGSGRSRLRSPPNSDLRSTAGAVGRGRMFGRSHRRRIS